MPFLSRKLPILAVLVLSASLQPILAFAQNCSAQKASTDAKVHATGTPGCAQLTSNEAYVSFLGGLKGQYAFILKGTLTAPGIASPATVAVGSFTADGQGGITSGEMDFTSAAKTFQRLSIVGNYTLDNYGIGTLNLGSTEGGGSFAFYTTGNLGSASTYALGSLVETDDGGPVVSSGSFYQQALTSDTFETVTGAYSVALTGETFAIEGTPSPISVAGNLFLDNVSYSVFANLTTRVGFGASETLRRFMDTDLMPDPNGRMAIHDYELPLNLAAYIIDETHILVVSTDLPQVAPLLSGTITRDSSPFK